MIMVWLDNVIVLILLVDIFNSTLHSNMRRIDCINQIGRENTAYPLLT